jgi:hypothetical protein
LQAQATSGSHNRAVHTTNIATKKRKNIFYKIGISCKQPFAEQTTHLTPN